MSRPAPSEGRRAKGPTVAVEDVSVAYGETEVLAGVSLSVESGEFVGLVGPNGAGKTTLLTAINGVVDPDAGRVRVAGDPVADLSSRATSRRVATVPQDTTVAFDFSVADVVEMGRTPYQGRLSGDPDSGEPVERALDRTETERFRDRSVGSLSGGERQRVVLARALAQETPALLLDEPTASLDINHQVRTLELVRDLTRSEDKAALAAIHDLDLAARFCDRVAVLSEGRVVAAGPPESVLRADHLRAAFDTAAAVVPNPVTGTPAVTPLSDRGEADLTAHVAGAGRPAARAVAALDAAGATVTAGPVPAGDLAATTARELGVDAVTVSPFEGVDADAETRVRDRLARSDVAVLAGETPPGVGRLVADHGAVVRVAGAEADPGGDVSPSADATADPASVVTAATRLAGPTAGADD